MADRIESLNIISPDAQSLFFGTVARCTVLHRAGSLADLRVLLEASFGDSARPLTIDLIGHSTREHHLLRLGDTAIDMLDPVVARFFQSVASDHLLKRLGVAALRLLGCETAVTPSGRRTMRLLASTLGVPVFGATKRLMKSHYDKLGFNPVFAHILVEAGV